ncbi:hypothetical protein Btru_068738 [Bulinus truncatus]|nr:hypothetical protein Btru_068738 [Bulinus truncatus]
MNVVCNKGILDLFIQKVSYKNGQLKINNDESHIFSNNHSTTLLDDLFSSKHFRIKARDFTCYPVFTAHQNYSELFLRLATFRNFVGDENVFVSKLAAMGFFYSGQGVNTDRSVTCYACGETIREWSNINDLKSRHCTRSTTCSQVIKDNFTEIKEDERTSQISTSECTSFVTNTTDDSQKTTVSANHDGLLNSDSGNIPKIVKGIKSLDIQSSNSLSDNDVKPNASNENDLAKNTQDGIDHVCLDFIKNPHNLTNSKDNVPGLTPEDIKKMKDIISTCQAKFPDYSTEEKRLETFTDMKYSLKKHDLAHAGFFCEGDTGITQCFYCEIRLRWKKDCNFMVHHAWKSPKCPYVRHVAGQEYVDAVQTLKAKDSQSNVKNDMMIDEQMVKDYISTTHKQQKLHIISAEQRSRQYSNNRASQGIETVNQRDADDLRVKYLCRKCRGRLKEVVHFDCGHCCHCFPCFCTLRTIQCPVCDDKNTSGFIVAKLSA